MTTISIVGLGYIGLPTAALFARHGASVIGVDVNPDVVATINRGKIHIVEPGLGELVAQVVGEGRFRAVVNPEPADAFLVAVPTPVSKDSHIPDLGYVESAFRSLAPVLAPGNIVILESTSPVGTTERMVGFLAALRPDLSIGGTGMNAVHVAFCPERVLPGRVLEELVSNSRVLGGITPEATQKAEEIYRFFVKGDMHRTNARTAEMVKLTENASRDVAIAFANELSLICDEHGIDVWELIRLANCHPRVNILQPGPGVGGHCIAVDPWFIIDQSPKNARLMRTAREINDGKPEWVVRKVFTARERLKAAGHSADTTKIAVLGLAFKPNIDDLRESPACRIAGMLAQERSLDLLLVEPHIDRLPASLASFDNCRLRTFEEAVTEADIVLILVAHDQFKRFPNGMNGEKAVINCVGLDVSIC